MSDYGIVTQDVLLGHTGCTLTVQRESTESNEFPEPVAVLFCQSHNRPVFSVAGDEVVEIRLA